MNMADRITFDWQDYYDRLTRFYLAELADDPNLREIASAVLICRNHRVLTIAELEAGIRFGAIDCFIEEVRHFQYAAAVIREAETIGYFWRRPLLVYANLASANMVALYQAAIGAIDRHEHLAQTQPIATLEASRGHQG